MNEQVDQKQLRLKRIVVGLGILLGICFCIVVGTIAYRLSKMGNEEAAEAAIASPATQTPMATMNAINLPLIDIAVPAGAKIVSVGADGGHYLVLMEVGDRQQLQVIDRADGALVQTLRFSPPQ
jgi:hypothetical protein